MKKISLIVLGLLVILMGIFTWIGFIVSGPVWYAIVQIVIGVAGAAIGFTKDY